ncbi:hypothetical protein [Terriglobus albidus]|uniref:hypothetical protein n=1 Tax=Terriglobus albidus TaxID=1592106 RepID=UPI0021DFD452|nr:hypothetical protein [Terriglobus albidus]
MLAFFVLVSVLLLVTLMQPQAYAHSRRRSQMQQYAQQTGGDFPDEEIPQDFPFSMTDDLNWGHGRHCIFWRQGHSYVIVMDVEIGFGKQRRDLTLMAARHDAATGVIWSMPREIEMRAEDGWVVLMKRRRYLSLSALLSTAQIEELRNLFLTSDLSSEAQSRL